jgi:WD40 repeat protein
MRTLAASLVLALLATTVAGAEDAVLKVATSKGVLTIQTSDPDIEILVKQRGERIILIDARTKKQVELRAGDLELSIIENDKMLSISTDTFTLKRDQQSVAVVRREPADPEKVGHLRILGKHKAFFTARFSGCGRFALSSGGGEMKENGDWVEADDKDVRIWDWRSGRVLHRLQHEGAGAGVFAAFSPDGKQVVTTSAKIARIWDTETGKMLRRFEHEAGMGWACWSPDGKRLLIGNGDKCVRLFDAATGQELRKFEGHTHERIDSLAFSPDGKRVASSGFDGTAHVWDADSGKEICVMDNLTGDTRWCLRQLAWLPDGKHLITASTDKNLKLWDAATGQEVRRFEGHTHFVESVAVTPDGKRAVSGSIDGAIRVWDVATGKEVHRFEGFHAADTPDAFKTIVHVAVSPDGRYLLSSGWDKALRLFRLP